MSQNLRAREMSLNRNVAVERAVWQVYVRWQVQPWPSFNKCTSLLRRLRPFVRQPASHQQWEIGQRGVCANATSGSTRQKVAPFCVSIVSIERGLSILYCFFHTSFIFKFAQLRTLDNRNNLASLKYKNKKKVRRKFPHSTKLTCTFGQHYWWYCSMLRLISICIVVCCLGWLSKCINKCRQAVCADLSTFCASQWK